MSSLTEFSIISAQMRPRGGRAGQGAGTVPCTAWDGAARLPSVESRGWTPKPPPRCGGASSLRQPHGKGRGQPCRHCPAHRHPHTTPQQQQGRGAPRWEWGFPWWHVPEQGPKPAWGSSPRRKQADGLLPTSWSKAEKEKSHLSPFGHFFLLSCLFPALPWGVWPHPGPCTVRCPPSSG